MFSRVGKNVGMYLHLVDLLTNGTISNKMFQAESPPRMHNMLQQHETCILRAPYFRLRD
jgi:hypothetical protein